MCCCAVCTELFENDFTKCDDGRTLNGEGDNLHIEVQKWHNFIPITVRCQSSTIIFVFKLFECSLDIHSMCA